MTGILLLGLIFKNKPLNDINGESLIQRALEKLSISRTVIVIAHRLSTLKHCDKIYEIHNGSIVGSGSYNEMIN